MPERTRQDRAPTTSGGAATAGIARRSPNPTGRSGWTVWIATCPTCSPVAGASVSAFDDHPVPGPVDAGSRVATTDDDGRFRIGGLPDRPVQVAVEADGFAHYSTKAARPGTGELLEIELNRGATLTGRVIDAAGDAVSGILVMIHSLDPDVLRHSFRPMTTETDADGRFRFDLLRSGPWTASAFGPEGGSSRAESHRIRLGEGVVREIELVLSAADAEVTGIVTNHNGDPVANAEVTIIGRSETAGAAPRRSAPSWQTGADQSGRFQHRGLPAGAATIIASHPEYRVIQREIRLESGSNEIPLVLQPGLEITGTLRSEDGLPVALGEDFGGRRAEQSVTLAPGEEAAVELSFEEGLHLTGWVTVAGQPPGGGNMALISGSRSCARASRH